MGTRIYLGGLPTAPIVKKLREAFDSTGPGEIISYQALADASGLKQKTSRFTTCLNAWRGEIRRQLNIETIAVAGEGIKLLAEGERADNSARTLKRGSRRVVKSYKQAAAIDTRKLTEEEKRVAGICLRVTEAMAEAVQRATKQLAVDLLDPKKALKAA